MLHMIGIDLVYIPEFKRQLELGGSTFLKKSFQVSELKNNQTEHLAGLWAAKEAVSKAARSTPKLWSDITVLQDHRDKIHAVFGEEQFEVSIAHHGEYAVAVAYRIS